jgi:hypothetical protein
MREDREKSMNEESGLEPVSEGMLGRGLSSAWQQLGPLSVGAVASSLLLVTGGRLLGRVLGVGAGRRLGWSTTVALLSVGLWLVAGPGGADEPDGGAADESDTTGTD